MVVVVGVDDSSIQTILTAKAKASDSYIASLTGTKPDQPHLPSSEVTVDRQESMVLQC